MNASHKHLSCQFWFAQKSLQLLKTGARDGPDMEITETYCQSLGSISDSSDTPLGNKDLGIEKLVDTESTK
jgi:hypothetical protein